MDTVVFLFLVFLVLASMVLVLVFAYFLIQTWRQGREYKEQVKNLSFQVTNLQQQVRASEQRLMLSSGEYQERERKIYGDLAVAAGDLTKRLDMFPLIEEVNSLMARMSPEDMRNLDLPWGHEYQIGMTQVAAQQGEAIAKLHEFGLRFALFIRYLKMTGATLSPSIRFFGELLQQQEDDLTNIAPKLRFPVSKEILAGAIATNTERLKKTFQNGEEPPSEQLVGKILQAIDQAVAELPDTVADQVVAGQKAEPARPSHPSKSAENETDLTPEFLRNRGKARSVSSNGSR